MPQLMPMNWMNLLLWLVLSVVILIVKNYFYYKLGDFESSKKTVSPIILVENKIKSNYKMVF